MKKKKVNNRWREVHTELINAGINKKRRVMELCRITASTFHLWIKNPGKISPANKIIIAGVYNIPLVELFPDMEGYEYTLPPDPVNIPKTKKLLTA